MLRHASGLTLNVVRNYDGMWFHAAVDAGVGMLVQCSGLSNDSLSWCSRRLDDTFSQMMCSRMKKEEKEN